MKAEKRTVYNDCMNSTNKHEPNDFTYFMDHFSSDLLKLNFCLVLYGTGQ